MKMSRRSVLGAMATAAVPLAAAGAPQIDPEIVKRNDASVEQLLKQQVTDPKSPWYGSITDDQGLHTAGGASAVCEALSASFVCPQSKFHGDKTLVERVRLAGDFLHRSQSSEGFIDLLITNFNSPPDTAFVVHNVATAAAVARIGKAAEMEAALRPFLLKAGEGLTHGGIHTPNHRWVVSSALAQLNALYPNPAYLKRIEQWLAEGIDIDQDGQFIERSTLTYNVVTDRAFVVLAAKLKRPELLDPVRRNLEAMRYFIHPDGEVVTEVSKRQDQFVRGTMAPYWFPLTYLAITDQNGEFATLAKPAREQAGRLSYMIEYPELNGALPAAKPLPTDYEKVFPVVGLARVRRGMRSASIIFQDNSRFFSFRHGDCVINAVRMASPFFGKGQFIPSQGAKQGSSFVLQRTLTAPYYQPLDPPQKVTVENWPALVKQRKQTQICHFEQKATLTETSKGFALRLQATGTPGVPVSIEINLREGGTLENCRALERKSATGENHTMWILEKGDALYRAGDSRMRIGPGHAEHSYVEMRGAEAKLPGPTLYLTGMTPFDHTIEFEAL